ncbi:hypothetical protein BRADI_3g32636v3, partial [Brachypodium distachyon]
LQSLFGFIFPSLFYKHVGTDFISMSQFWVANKKHSVMNVVCAAVLWSLWTPRNDLIFNHSSWSDIKQIWWLIMRTLWKWEILFKEDMLGQIHTIYQHISQMINAPHLLLWI